MMGVDFIEKKNEKYQKTIDLKKASLVNFDILTEQPKESPTLYTAIPVQGQQCGVGVEVIVEFRNGECVGSLGNKVILKFVNLPSSVKQTIATSKSAFCGTVETINPISGQLGVTLS